MVTIFLDQYAKNAHPIWEWNQAKEFLGKKLDILNKFQTKTWCNLDFPRFNYEFYKMTNIIVVFMYQSALDEKSLHLYIKRHQTL